MKSNKLQIIKVGNPKIKSSNELYKEKLDRDEKWQHKQKDDMRQFMGAINWTIGTSTSMVTINVGAATKRSGIYSSWVFDNESKSMVQVV
jgi:hypothetical protein